LHDDSTLRRAILGSIDWVPSLFTYDPRRIYVEFDSSGRLIVTALDLSRRIPLVRYAAGDRGGVLKLPAAVQPAVEAKGISWATLKALPLVIIAGRGDAATTGAGAVFPEAVKEGIYLDAELAGLTTANFRLVAETQSVLIRIQL